MTKKHKTIFVAVALAIQLLALGWMICRYEWIVLKGTEVRFRCQAYDPYDPFLGRYLSTRVEEDVAISENEIVTETDSHGGIASWSEKVTAEYARIIPQNDGTNLSCVAEVAKEPHGEGLWVKPERIYCHGAQTARVRFPSKLYVNEDLARKADEILRKNTEKAVAVYRVKGHEILLSDIEIDGVSILTLAK